MIFHNDYTLEGFSKPCKKFGRLGENYKLFFQVAHKNGHSVKFLKNVFQDAQE
jgi:hypothetical protein